MITSEQDDDAMMPVERAGDRALESEVRQRGPKELISVILSRRDNRAFGAQMAAIRSGLTAATEMYAFGYTEPYFAGMSLSAATGARRAAAITAIARDTLQVPAGKHQPLGQSLRRLYASENPGRDPVTQDSAFTRQVNCLPLLDVESTAAVLSLLVQRCGPAHVALDFYDLLDTLTHWGNGIDNRSRETRAGVVARFYRTA